MKQRLFIDTNVVLDLLNERKPYYNPIAQIASLADNDQVIMVVSPISFTTVYYFISKYESSTIAIEKLRKITVLCEICTIDEHTVKKGLNSEFKDFEDSLQYYCATESRCDVIITRNQKDFKKSTIPVMNSMEYLQSIK
jgi:predicted nucleic acid-binding protein